MRKLLWMAAGSVLTAVSLVAVMAWAAAGGTHYIPYRGHLDQGAQPVTRTGVPMVFHLYANDTDPTELDHYSANVDVRGGDFSVVMGPFLDSAFSGQVWVGVDVDGAPLQGRQRIYAVPQAAHGEGGLPFASGLDLITSGGGWLRVSGSEFHLGFADGRSAGTNVEQRAMVHDNNDTLVINFAQDFEGGTRVDGPLKVQGRAVTTGAEDNLAFVRGAVQSNSQPWWGTGFNSAATGTAGSPCPARGTGTACVWFNTPFTSLPAVTVSRITATNNDPAGGGGGTERVCSVLAVQSNYAIVQCYRPGGASNEFDSFSFIAVGPR
jgi:hypothetical protein